MDPNQQQLLLTSGGAEDKVYIDDVFSTNVYKGAGSGQVINNGIDNSTEGGMVWFKRRDGTYDHQIVDTIRGGSKGVQPNTTNGTVNTQYISSFNTNGYTLGTESAASGSGDSFAAWNFRKKTGFFDIVTYTGNGAGNHQISHNLGCIPGCIMVKCTSESQDWMVYHVGTTDWAGPGGAYLKLNSDAGQWGSSGGFYNTTATSTVFTLGDGDLGNKNNATYVAYLFGGGASSAATAKSVDFSGQEGLDVAASSALNLGTGDFTIEGWLDLRDAPGTGSPSYGRFFQLDGPTVNAASTNLQITIQPQTSTKALYVQEGANQLITADKYLRTGWNHIALTRSGTTLRVFVNGTQDGIATTSQSFNPNGGSPRVRLGYADSISNNNGVFQGKVSNFRITTNQVLYTSNFKPPITPLTTTSQGATASNVKLLFCNSSSVTGSTVTPGTITAAGSPTGNTYSPFSDPESSTYGVNADQDILKCGSYIGHPSRPFEVNLGWEPQFIIFKCITSGSSNWSMFDSMRGIITKDQNSGSNGHDTYLYPNLNQAEYSAERISLTPTGFIVDGNAGVLLNSVDQTYGYIAIRRSDGLVGKPAAAGTDVWSNMYGKTDNTTPTFVSGFVTDFGFFKETPASAGSWYSQHRLTGTGYMIPSNGNGEATSGNNKFDYQNGFYAATGNWGASMNWLWKRHAGFDVVTYKGANSNAVLNGDSRKIPHSLGRTPEMICVKRRSYSEDWTVYHSGMGDGSPAINYHMQWNNTTARADGSSSNHYVWGGVAPDATHFSVGPANNPDRTNNSNSDYVAMLFANVDGICKCGYYDGSSYDVTISDVGFQPRFVLIKAYNNTRGWTILDTVRGWGSGVDNKIMLNDNAAQNNTWNYGEPTATGFTVSTGQYDVNFNGWKYIYYAHA